MPFRKNLRFNANIFDNKLVCTFVKALHWTGYIIDERHQSEMLQYLRSVFVTFLIKILFLLELASFVISIANQRGNAISSATTFLFMMLSITYDNIFFRRARLTQMLAFLQDDVEKLFLKTDERELELLEEAYRYIRNIAVWIMRGAFLGGFISYVDALYRFAFNPESIFNLEEIRNGSSNIPFLIRLFPYREVHDGLFVGYFLPMVSLFFAITAIPLWPTFITSLMSYIILKWKIMHKRLSEMDISKVILEPYEQVHYSQIAAENERVTFLQLRVCKFCVNEQIRIRWFIGELQELICIPVFADFVVCSVLICFLFLEMATGNLTNMDILFMFLYITTMLALIWLYYWHATLVKEHSHSMCFAIYSCDWYNYPVKLQKIIRLVMMMTDNPLNMKAIFVPLNLTTFVDIIRASYSYFSILRKYS